MVGSFRSIAQICAQFRVNRTALGLPVNFGSISIYGVWKSVLERNGQFPGLWHTPAPSHHNKTIVFNFCYFVFSIRYLQLKKTPRSTGDVLLRRNKRDKFDSSFARQRAALKIPRNVNLPVGGLRTWPSCQQQTFAHWGGGGEGGEGCVNPEIL